MKTYLIKNTLLLSLLLPVFSCSTLNKDECKTANWNTIGYGDGSQGYKASRISLHRKACAEYGVQPNLNAYNIGRNKGLIQYCIPNTAYKRGLSGYSYNDVCNNNNEPAFRQAYNYGASIYQQIYILNNMKKNLVKEQDFIISLEREINESERLIVNGQISRLDARRLLDQTKSLVITLDRTRSHLPELENDIYQQQQRVYNLKSNKQFH